PSSSIGLLTITITITPPLPPPRNPPPDLPLRPPLPPNPPPSLGSSNRPRKIIQHDSPPAAHWDFFPISKFISSQVPASGVRKQYSPAGKNPNRVVGGK
ncbi:uncharacterized protein LY89DRAFT_787965, partial [Mollisia scopiformis]